MRVQKYSIASIGCVLSFCAITHAAPVLDGEMTTITAAPGNVPNTTWWEAQSVTPTRALLTSVEFFINPGPSTWNPTVSVYGQSVDNGTSVATFLGSSTVATAPSETGLWHTFSFPDLDVSAYSAVEGTGRLLLVLQADVPVDQWRYVYGNLSSDAYAGGNWYYTPNSGADFISRDGDMVFRFYTADAVPEPSAALVTAISCGLLSMRRKRSI